MNDNYQNIRELFHLDAPCPLPEEDIEQIRKQFGAIPKALEDYYRLCGGCAEMNATQDFLVTPDGRYGNYHLNLFSYPDYCVFYAENQCVAEWAIKKSDLNQENPPVYETYDDGRTWHQICDSVSDFLISEAYMQSALSKEYSSEEFYQMTPEQFQILSEKFPCAGIYETMQFLQPYQDTVLMISKFKENFSLLYSSDSEEHFEEIDGIISEILGFESDEEE
ncbi:MAG: SMI1/KNR4 family protein [Oscillospiraceae bacterium]|nr:SMI1/KNR4 family protein [Oscillospiraceae bacterium]